MRPATEAELAEALRDAAGPVAVRGGGTRSPAPGGLPVLSAAGIAGIRLYEPGALTLVVAAGTPLAEVEAALAAEGQRLAFEPPDLRGLLGTAGVSTIGGVAAANASGPRRVQAGACRDAMLGVRFVDGTGAVVANGGRVMKNVTGYDLVKLMAGSRGRLGVLTEIAFKVLPAPEAAADLTLRGLDDARAVAAMAAALGTPFEVTGAAHLPEAGTTHLRIEGFAAAVAYRAGRLAERLASFGPAEIETDAARVAARWAGIRDVAPLHGRAGDVWRLSLRATEAPGLVAQAGAFAALYDWGGGLVWLLVAPGTDLRARLGPFAGHATRLRATDPADGIAADPPEAPAVAALTAGLIARFDPRGILNRAAACAA